jgi:hypothetical protein
MQGRQPAFVSLPSAFYAERTVADQHALPTYSPLSPLPLPCRFRAQAACGLRTSEGPPRVRPGCIERLLPAADLGVRRLAPCEATVARPAIADPSILSLRYPSTHWHGWNA